LLATGNGRCNLTNIFLNKSNFHGEDNSFVDFLLKKFDFVACKDFFREIGLEIVEGSQGRCYPLSLHARSVVDILYKACIYHKVEFYMERAAEKIIFKNSNFLICTGKEEFKTKKLLIATGGKAAPSLGGNEDGLRLAKSLGHRIISTFPTLVQLTTSDKNIHLASGAKLVCALQIKVNNLLVQSIEGDVLFTKYGLSGSAILDISRNATYALKNGEKVEIVLDLFPKTSKQELMKLLEMRLEKAEYLSTLSWLGGILNPILVPPIVKIMNLKKEEKFPKEKKVLRQLIYHLKNWNILIDGDRGFKGAEVMAGGVDVREVDEKTMASKLHEGLYFSGEVLDIDGDCGGYNLHFAWASGLCAGEAMAN
ncbi:MAG: aminoacetone oxidase family FAD-binding enzyme, partial [Campylobacteraceae bacterium]|nr:aminoacetone oxidase family FAD-binding enzyme [Campylobacteraceae bacterium]